MNHCGQCLYFNAIEGAEPAQGNCHGLPPTVMLVPSPPDPKRDLLALSRKGPAPVQMGLQAFWPVIVAEANGCSLWRPASLNG